MKSNLLISFPDQTPSFTYGVEYGRILQKLQQGNHIVNNDGLPVRIENKEVLLSSCITYGYIPSFGDEWEGWVSFTAIKNDNRNN